MCKNLTPLAVSSDLRRIYRCEHGTIHFTWEVLTTYLNLETLSHLVELTRLGQTIQKPGQIVSGPCQLFYTNKGHFQLWVKNVGVVLSKVDLEILTDMVHVAFKEVTQPTTQGQPAENSKGYQRTVKASTRQLFSNN